MELRSSLRRKNWRRLSFEVKTSYARSMTAIMNDLARHLREVTVSLFVLVPVLLVLRQIADS